MTGNKKQATWREDSKPRIGELFVRFDRVFCLTPRTVVGNRLILLAHSAGVRHFDGQTKLARLTLRQYY